MQSHIGDSLRKLGVFTSSCDKTVTNTIFCVCRAAAAKQRLIEKVRDRRAELDRLIAERRKRMQQQKVRSPPHPAWHAFAANVDPTQLGFSAAMSGSARISSLARSGGCTDSRLGSPLQQCGVIMGAQAAELCTQITRR